MQIPTSPTKPEPTTRGLVFTVAHTGYMYPFIQLIPNSHQKLDLFHKVAFFSRLLSKNLLHTWLVIVTKWLVETSRLHTLWHLIQYQLPYKGRVERKKSTPNYSNDQVVLNKPFFADLARRPWPSGRVSVLIVPRRERFELFTSHFGPFFGVLLLSVLIVLISYFCVRE